MLPGRGGFKLVEQVFVEDRLRAHRVGALLDNVVNAAQDGVGRRLALGQPEERFYLLDQAVFFGQHRRLPAQVARLPAKHVAEQRRRLVVQVVARGDHAELVVYATLLNR